MIEVLLGDGEVEAAWRLAVEHGCPQPLWMALARAREDEHPLDAVRVYQREIEDLIDRKQTRWYEQAAAQIVHGGELYTRAGADEEFRTYLDDLRHRHKPKTKFLAMLSAAVAPDRPLESSPAPLLEPRRYAKGPVDAQVHVGDADVNIRVTIISICGYGQASRRRRSEMPRPAEVETITPEPAEATDLRMLVTHLYEDGGAIALRDAKGHDVPLPPSVGRLVFEAVRELASGNAVTVVPTHTVLTTQQAADLLNVSRPYLVRLLDAKEIPYGKVGTHRRVQLADLLEYRRRRDAERETVLRRMGEQAEDSGLEY